MTRPRAASVLLPVLLSGFLLLTACSDGDEPVADGTTPGGAPSSSADSGSEQPQPEPVATFGFGGSEPGTSPGASTKVTIGCNGFDEYLLYEQLSVDTKVELLELTTDGTDIQVGRTWISDDPEQSNRSGLPATEAQGGDITDEPGWADREKLAGAVLEPGTQYTVFAELTIGSQARQQQFAVDYLIGDRRETADWAYPLKRTGSCR